MDGEKRTFLQRIYRQDSSLSESDSEPFFLTRAADSTEEDSFKRELWAQIKCPVCLEVPLPPLYLCENGHIICNECQGRTTKCAMCRSNYTKTRNLVAETIVNGVSMKCQHRDEGCDLIAKGSEMKQHLQVCEFRPFNCCICTSTSGNSKEPRSLSFSDILSHYKDYHEINGYESPEGMIEYNVPILRFANIPQGYETFKPFYYNCFDQNFLVQLCQRGHSLCLWVCLLGRSIDCPKYGAIIECTLGNREFQWKGCVNYFRDDSTDDIFDNANGLTLPLQSISRNRLIASDSSICWTYNIKIYEVSLTNQDKLDTIKNCREMAALPDNSTFCEELRLYEVPRSCNMSNNLMNGLCNLHLENNINMSLEDYDEEQIEDHLFYGLEEGTSSTGELEEDVYDDAGDIDLDECTF